MTDNSDSARDAIHQVIQENVHPGMDAILTGWAIVAEWMDADGDRYLSKAHASSTAAWEANGMWHEALFGDWPPGTEEPG